MDIKGSQDLFEIWSSPSEDVSPSAGQAFRRFASRAGFPDRAGIRFRFFLCTLALLGILLPAAFLAGSRAGKASVPEMEDYVEYYTGVCRRDSLTLPDGSRVLLNSGSRLLYPTSFTKKERKVFLYGEAYFEVAKDDNCPFRILSGDIDVKVLGTKFNMSAYDDLRYLSVSLVEGSVDVGLSSGEGTRLSMVPGEVVRYDKMNGTLAKSNQLADACLSWTEGSFYFHKQPLHEIVSQYERAFGVSIVIAGPELRDKEFNVAFVNGESLETMLSAIARIGKFRWSNESGFILITK